LEFILKIAEEAFGFKIIDKEFSYG
jgi:hypothetical protein